MSTSDLKIDLINKISQLKEIRIIQEIKRLLDFELENEVYELNVNQKNRIAKAKNEYSQSDILSEKEANIEIESWLKER